MSAAANHASTCFVMMPYQPAFLTIYNDLISPAVAACQLQSILPLEGPPGPIMTRITIQIADAAVCIADLTGNNPNVIYEVAIAHHNQTPVILITQGDPESIPFDIRHHRFIQYESTVEGLGELRQKLEAALNATLGRDAFPTHLIRKVIVPRSLGRETAPHVVAASPLSYRAATGSQGGWATRAPGTHSDHVGIRGLMQAFGLIYGLHRLPHLVDPNDFRDTVLDRTMNLYSIGSPKANRWTGILMRQFFGKRDPAWEFKPDPESSNLRNPKVLVRKDGRPYAPPDRKPGRLRWDFGLVIRGPNPRAPKCLSMVLAGRSSLGTEAACLAATDGDCVQQLSRALNSEGLDLDNHSRSFCAVVSIESHADLSEGRDPSTFRVSDVFEFAGPDSFAPATEEDQ